MVFTGPPLQNATGKQRSAQEFYDLASRDPNELIDRERPDVSDNEARLEHLRETAHDLALVREAKKRLAATGSEAAYGTPDEVDSAEDVISRSYDEALKRVSQKDIKDERSRGDVGSATRDIDDAGDGRTRDRT